MSYAYLQRDGELCDFVCRLQERKVWRIALDIEGDSNRHAYGETLSLIQVHDGADATIIDALKMSNSALKQLFECRDILKVMYDASGDLHLLKRANGITAKSILDLRPAVELLGYAHKDLHSVIQAELGVALQHKESYQQRNWLLRPIPEDALQYAVDDVAYLLPLKDAIMKRLGENQLLERFILKNLQAQNKDIEADPKPRYERMPGYYVMNEAQQAVFRRAFDVRDRFARKYNLPPFRIFPNEMLMPLARDARYLSRMRLPFSLSKEAVGEITSALKEALGEVSEAKPPHS